MNQRILIAGVRAERARIDLELEKLHAEKEELQKTCPHTNATKKGNSSTGSWDRDDSYWWEFDCPDCGKRWTEPQ